MLDRWHRDTRPFHEAARSCHVEFERATEQARLGNPSEEEIRVCDSGFFAPAIANWAGNGSGALRADSESSCAIESCQRAATGSYGVDVEHRDTDRKVRHDGLGRCS